MPDTGLANSPKLIKGAIVQIIVDIVGFVPNVIPFQYNPAKLNYTISPWDPSAVDQTQRGAQAPNVQPFEPKQTFTLEIELDAADDLEDSDPVAVLVGVSDRIAALKRLLLPTKGLLGDRITSVQALIGTASAQAKRPTVPVAFFVWGPGKILPVRVTTFSVEETLFSPTLHPLQATVSLGLVVLTPDVFKGEISLSTVLAVAAFHLTKLQDEALAVAHIAKVASAVKGIIPL